MLHDSMLCPKLMFPPLFFFFFNFYKTTCERCTIETNEREKIQDSLIDTSGSSTFSPREIHTNENKFFPEIYDGKC